MSTLGRNIAFPIYKGNGSSFHNLVIRKSTSDSVVMSLGDKVTGDVYYKDNTLVCDMDEYIMVDGVKYSIVNPPTIVREGLKSDNGDLKGMTKYSFEFYHPMYMLGNMAFSDVAVTNAESMFKSHDRTFSWIGNLTDFVAKLNKNLQDSQFIVSISSSIDANSRNVLSDVLNFTNNTIADALKTAYDTWHFPFVVDVIKSGEQYYSQGKRFLIQFGNPTREILDANNQPFVFHFGKGVGLKNNSRTPRNNKIVTRVAGYGSEQNIPYGYPQIPWTGDPSATTTADGYPIYEGIVGGVVTKLVKHPFTRTHLMPSVYSESVRKKVNSAALDYDNTTPLVDYYDAPVSYPNPINLDAPKLDIVGFEEIKPELGDMAIVSAVPVNDDLTPASGWDDTMDDDGNYHQSYFKVTLPQLDFDIYATASITEEMKLNMRSGACIGCTFDVQVDWDDYKKNFFDAQGNFLPNGSQRDLTKYPKSNLGSITVVCKKDINTYGTLMPNVYQNPHQGDKFVILGISLPTSYITNAEARLDTALMTHMLDNNVYYYDYPLKFDEDFLYNHTDILSQLRTNMVLRFMFGGVEKSLYVKQITIKYGEGVLPKYDITLTDNIEVVLNQIGLVADDVSRLALAMMQTNKKLGITTINSENTANYVNYTVMPNIRQIEQQMDGMQVTYFGNEVPTTSNYPANEWAVSSFPDHDGDMYYNRTTGKGYEFTSNNGTWGWQLIQDEDIVNALQAASEAQDTADGKRRVFVTQPTTDDEYDIGDLWVNATYPANYDGKTIETQSEQKYNNDILKATTHKDSGIAFSISHWKLASKYTDDSSLYTFITGTYADDLQDIETQIDGKAETWYQPSDPSSSWATTTEKQKHKGDIWHNTYSDTINGVKSGQDAIWSGSAWVVDETVPAAIYDEIDGKCAIYVSWGAWGNDLQEKDLFIPSANVTPTGSSVTYYANKVYRCVDKDTPLFQEIAYTDDTQYNGFITKLIGSSGQTKDAAENAIAAIKHALNEGNTYNEGGLILSNLISLGTGNPTSGTFTPWAGISGIYKTSETGTGYKGHGIAAWFGGGMVDKEVSQSATNAAKSLFRFDGSGYVANGNITWDENGQVTIQGYQIKVGGSNVATESSISTFFANFFDIYNGSTQITYEQYVALQDKSNVSIKAKYGLWTEQFLSALGLNSQGGGGTGEVSAIRVSSTTLLQPTDGVIDMTNYVSTATQRSHWDAIYAKVPAATYNTGNELADKNFVNSSISTATAEYQGSKNLVSDLSLTTSATRTQIGTALGTAISGADNNDYCFVEIPTSDSDPTQIARVERYKYNGTSWSYEYTLNNSGFTSNQWSAINSGITSTHVTKLNGIAAGAQVNVLESVKINGTALSISSKAVNILTGNGLQSSTNTISIKLDTNSGLLTSSSGLKLDIVNDLVTNNAYKALSAAQGKSLNDRLAVLESWFEVDANGDIKTKNTAGGHVRGFYTESFVSALGSNSSGGGGGGDVSSVMFDTSISYHTGTPVYTATDGVIHLPPYPTSVTWANVSGKPSWIGSSKPTYSLSEISGTDDLQAIEGLTGTSGLLKKTAANTWTLDTNTYITGNQTITLSGDVSGSGATSISVTIGQGKVTNAMLAGSIANGKLQNSSVTVNGTSVSLGDSITTEKWGTARNITIKDADSTNSGTAVSVNGSAAVTLLLPSTIKASLSGTATSATKLTTVSKKAWGQTYWTSGGVPQDVDGTLTISGGELQIWNTADTSAENRWDMRFACSGDVFQMWAYEGAYHDLAIGNTAAATATYNGLYYDASEKSWGIGTITPAYTLDVQGTINAYGAMYLGRNGHHLYVTDSNNTKLSALVLNTSNAFLIGYGTHSSGYNTSLYGNNVYLRYGTSGTIGLTLSSAGVVSIPSTGKLKIGDCTIEWDSTNNMLKFDKGIYSTGSVSALGANSSGGGGGGGTVTGITLGGGSAIQPDSNGIIAIPAASSSAYGVIKVGTTLAISSGVLNQKSGIATAGTYPKVTVDTYGRVTAGASLAASDIPSLAASKITSGTFDAARIPNLSWNKITSDLPTTISGYGITDAFTQAQSWYRFYALYGGTQISATSDSHADLNTYTSYGSYYCSSNGTADYVDNLPTTTTDAFRLWVSAAVGTGTTYLRQRFQYYTGTAIYERTSSNGGSSWNSWYLVQANLANYASASDVTTLQGYFTNGVANSATSATTASKLSTVSKTAWGQTYWTSGGVPTNISGNLSSVGNIYMDNAKTIFIQDTDGTDRSVLNFSSNNNVNLGYGTYNLGTGTYIYGKTLVVRIGGTAASANAVQVDESKNMTVTGYVAVGTGGANSRLVSDAADNIYLANSSGNVLVCKAKVVRRGSSLADVTLGSSTYPWGGVYSTTGSFSSTLSVTGASTLTGNVTTSGHIYMGNNKYIYMQNSDASSYSVLYLSSTNNLHVGYGTAGASMSTYINGYSVVLRYGTSRTAGLTLDSDGNVTVANNLSVTGATTLSSTLSVTGAVTMSSNLTVSGWVKPIGNLVMGIATASMNANSTQIHFRTGNMTDFTKNCSPYIQAIGGSTYGRKRLSIFQNNGTSSNYDVAYTEAFTVLANGNVGVNTASPSQKLNVDGNILASGEVTASSDERKKNIISNTKFNVKDIASARSIIYEWNDDRDKDNEKKIHGGSIAQDWLGKADSFLSQDNDGWYSINYGALALCSAITIAKEVVKHEDEITRLKKEVVKLRERVAELEERRIA